MFAMVDSTQQGSDGPLLIGLTGGTSKMEGVVDLAEEIFHMPVRVGAPQTVQGLQDIVRNPIYSTAVGLLIYGTRQQVEGMRYGDRGAAGSGFIERVKQWFQGNF